MQFSNFATSSQNVTGEKSYQFSGLELQDLLVVEVCAGTARLTKTVRARGIRGLAVGKSKSKTCGTDIMILDLIDPLVSRLGKPCFFDFSLAASQ